MLRVKNTPARDIPVSLPAQFWRHSPRFGAGLLLLGAYHYCQYWFDTRLARAINAALGGEVDLARNLGLALMGVALGALVIRVLSRVAIFNGGRIAEYELRKALLDRLQRLGPSFYRRMSTGDIMSRVTNDLLQVRLLLGFGVLTSINTVFAFTSALAVTLVISPSLTLAALSTVPLLIIAMRAFAKHMYVRQRENQEAIGELSTAVQSSIAGVRVVRSFALEADELRRFEKNNQEYLEKALSLARLRGLMFPVMQAITAVGIVVVLLYGGYLMLGGTLGAGDFLAFYRALTRLTWPLISARLSRFAIAARSSLLREARRGLRSGARHRRWCARAAPSRRADGSRSVTFRLHTATGGARWRELRPRTGPLPRRCRSDGQRKSTLAVLLARLQPTPRDTVFLDGVDICDLPVETVRGTIGYAQQSAFLFSTTVGRNIAFALLLPIRPPGNRSFTGPPQKQGSWKRSKRCPMASIRWSASAACSSRAGKNSAWRSRVASSPSRASSCSTTR